MPISREESGVEQYLKEIQTVALLTAEDERRLARRMRSRKKGLKADADRADPEDDVWKISSRDLVKHPGMGVAQNKYFGLFAHCRPNPTYTTDILNTVDPGELLPFS